MAEAVIPALVGGAVQAILTPSPPPPPEPPPAPEIPEIPLLSREEAMQLAQATLDPLFNQQVQEALRQTALQNMRRGFYGQRPGDELSERVQSDIESARASSIAQLAEQMVGQNQQAAIQAAALARQNALDQYSLAQQRWQQQSNNILRGIQTGLLGAQMCRDWTGQVPFGGGLSFGARQQLTNIGAPQVLNSPPVTPYSLRDSFKLNQTFNLSSRDWLNPY